MYCNLVLLCRTFLLLQKQASNKKHNGNVVLKDEVEAFSKILATVAFNEVKALNNFDKKKMKCYIVTYNCDNQWIIIT